MMSQARLAPMSSDEFLAWEARQELKWEFDGFQPVAMTGGTWNHSGIQVNLIAALIGRLRGKLCRASGPDLKIAIPDRGFRYPDAFVTCSRVEPAATIVREPVVIFEILSESTQVKDRTVKLTEYRSIPTLRRYVMFEQTQAYATIITRTDETWSIDVLRSDDVLAMPEIGIELPLSEVYEGIEFDEPLP